MAEPTYANLARIRAYASYELNRITMVRRLIPGREGYFAVMIDHRESMNRLSRNYARLRKILRNGRGVFASPSSCHTRSSEAWQSTRLFRMNTWPSGRVYAATYVPKRPPLPRRAKAAVTCFLL